MTMSNISRHAQSYDLLTKWNYIVLLGDAAAKFILWYNWRKKSLLSGHISQWIAAFPHCTAWGQEINSQTTKSGNNSITLIFKKVKRQLVVVCRKSKWLEGLKQCKTLCVTASGWKFATTLIFFCFCLVIHPQDTLVNLSTEAIRLKLFHASKRTS